MTIEQAAYLERCRQLNPGTSVIGHESACGSIIAEIRATGARREYVLGLVRLDPTGKIVESAR